MNLRSKCLGSSKGQFSIEYLVAFVLFASILIYLSFQMAGIIPELYQQSQENLKSLKATSITESLIKTPGNWSGGANSIKYGLADEPYLLNETKTRMFNRTCETDYGLVREGFGLKNTTGFHVTVLGVKDGEVYVDCGVEHIPSGVGVEGVERYGVLNGDIVTLVLKVW